MNSALHRVAAALGVEQGAGCDCAVCGRSPYDAHGRARQALGPNFRGWQQLVDADCDAVCRGCKAVLAGRPGRKPPPLRMVSFEVRDGSLRPLAQADWWPILTQPPTDSVVSWAIGRKKHHALHAGISGGGWWRVGSDDGRVEWRHDERLPGAVESLRRIGASKGAILTGRYRPALQAAHGGTIEEAEEALRQWRGGSVLALVVHAAPGFEDIDEERRMPIAKEDAEAVRLLADIARGSDMRVQDGIRFWGGYYLARIGRHSRRPLPDLVSRLVGECRVGTTAAAGAAARVRDMDEELAAAVSAAIRSRTPGLHALAFDEIQKRKGKA